MTRFFNVTFAIIILATAFTVGAEAQSSSSQRVIADIPFGFTAIWSSSSPDSEHQQYLGPQKLGNSLPAESKPRMKRISVNPICTDPHYPWLVSSDILCGL